VAVSLREPVSGAEAVPVTLLGGYLGSGKTTLINQVLAATESRLAVLVNDVGALTIDADLIESHEGDTIELGNGCVCCSFGDDFAEAFVNLSDRPQAFDQVIVELSGVADPAKVRPWASSPGFALDGVVILIDADRFPALDSDRWLADTVQRQAATADLLVLTKLDLVDRERITAVTQRLGELAGGVAVVEAGRGDDAGLTTALEVMSPIVRTGEHTNPVVQQGGEADPHVTRVVHPGAATDAELRQFLEVLVSESASPMRVIRSKGIVALGSDSDSDSDSGAGNVLVHTVGSRISLTPTSLPATGLMVIEVPAAS